MKQSYVINADKVIVKTDARKMMPKDLRLGRIPSLRQARIDLNSQQADRFPDRPQVHVEPVGVSTGAPDTSQLFDVDLRRDEQLVDPLQHSAHETSLPLDDVAGRTADAGDPSVGNLQPDAVPLFTADRAEERVVPDSSGELTAGTTLKPYYQDELVTIYNGDCIDLAHVWLGADVLITDPPYGLQPLAGAYGFSSSSRGSVTIANDMDTSFRDRVLELWGEKPVAVFGSPRLTEPPGGWTDRLVWDKQQLGLNGGPWRYVHESIFVRGPGWERIDNKSSSILRYSSQANRANVAKHIHSKPVPLVARLIASAPEGVIVDPFAGGGSTVEAAMLLGRQIIAIELEEEHCATMVSRLQQQAFNLGAIT